MYLFNKRVLKFFRKDGHSWRRRRDQRTIAEAHERLKVFVDILIVVLMELVCLDIFFPVPHPSFGLHVLILDDRPLRISGFVNRKLYKLIPFL